MLCFELLTLFAPYKAYWVWTSFNFVLLLTTIAILVASSAIPAPDRVVLVALGILYEPVSENFFWAQLQIVLLFVLALNLRWVRAGKDAAAGLALAVAILLKAFPAILLVHFVLARRIRLATWTLGGTIVGESLTVLLVGRGAFGFLQAGMTTPNVWWNASLSVNAIISRMFSALLPRPPTPATNLVRIALISSVFISLLIVAARATLRSVRLGREDSGYAIWVVLVVFLFPITWINHMVLLLIPLSQIAVGAYQGDRVGCAPVLALASYVVAEMVLPLFWIYWLTWFVPLLRISAILAQLSGALAFCGAYQLVYQRQPRAAQIEPRPFPSKRCND